ADGKAIPIMQGGPQVPFERGTLAGRHFDISCNQRRHHHFGGASSAVVAFYRDTNSRIRKGCAQYAFGPHLEEYARTEEPHDIGAESPRAGNMPWIRDAGSTQACRRLGARGPETLPGAEPRKAKGQISQRHRPGWRGTAIDAARCLG